MKPFTNKHSIAAGSPLHQGGSYKNSPLEQRVQRLGPEPTGAEAYYTPPGYTGTSGGYNLVGNTPPNFEEPLTPERLATRIDVVSGDPLDYNTTSGTVEMQGGRGAYDLKPRKTINLEGVSNPTTASVTQRAIRNAEVPITNQEYNSNKWSSQNRRNFPRETNSTPQITYKANAASFARKRDRDSLGTMHNRNLTALDQRLRASGQYLRPEQLTKEQMIKYNMFDTK